MAAGSESRARVFVSTDLGGDADDIQSLFRLVHYSDLLRVEGLGSVCGPQATPRAGLIWAWLRRIEVDSLRDAGHTGLASEAALLSVTCEGQKRPGAPAASRTTQASERLIDAARAAAAADQVLWFLGWGALTDLAQALHAAPDIAPHLRIHWISASNRQADPESHLWVWRFMAFEYPSLWWIENGAQSQPPRDTFRGMYLAADGQPAQAARDFIPQVIRPAAGCRPDSPRYRCGEAFPGALPPHGLLKECDSPTLLHLLGPRLAGVGAVEDPGQPGWGGQYARPAPERWPNYWCDLPLSPAQCRETVARWRADQLQDWAQRWQRYPGVRVSAKMLGAHKPLPFRSPNAPKGMP